MRAELQDRLAMAGDTLAVVEERGVAKERERAIQNLFRVGSSDSFIVELGYTPEEIQKAKAKLDILTH